MRNIYQHFGYPWNFFYDNVRDMVAIVHNNGFWFEIYKEILLRGNEEDINKTLAAISSACNEAVKDGIVGKHLIQVTRHNGPSVFDGECMMTMVMTYHYTARVVKL